MVTRGIIIIGGNVQGLGLMRAFTRAGIDNIMITNRRFDLANFSRYSSNIILEDMTDPEKLLDFLLELGKNNKYKKWILLPTNDSVVYTLSKNRKQLEKVFILTTQDFKIIQTFYNKKIAYEIADNNNIPIPNTFYPTSFDDLMNNIDNIEFPCILKPAIMHKFHEETGKKVIKVVDEKGLKEKYIEMMNIIPQDEIMVQEIIPGVPANLYSYGGFFSEMSKIMTVMSHERQFPMDFGVRTYVKTVNYNEIIEHSENLLKNLKYEGFCEVEFIKDPRDGKLKFLEVNPRSWKQILLLTQSKNDFSKIAHNYYMGQSQDHHELIEHGYHWIHLWQDCLVVLSEFLKGRLRLKDIIESYRGPIIFAVASKEDPLPFIIEPFTYLQYRLSRILNIGDHHKRR